MKTIEVIRALVRPYIAFCLVTTSVYLVVTGKIDRGDWWQAVLIIITFYFAERALKRAANGGEGGDNVPDGTVLRDIIDRAKRRITGDKPKQGEGITDGSHNVDGGV